MPMGVEHSQITDFYHVMEGTGTLFTGATMKNPKPETPHRHDQHSNADTSIPVTFQQAVES